MDHVDLIGFLAAGLVLLTFCMQSMRGLRVIAIFSNIAFVVYGLQADLLPVILLHLALLPLNSIRLAQEQRRQPETATAGTRR